MQNSNFEQTKKRVQDKLIVKRIQEKLARGTKLSAIAKELGVSMGTLANVLLGSARRGSEALVCQRWRDLHS